MDNINNTEWITSVEETEGGYKINGNMFVPNDTGNRHYQMVQQWIKEGGRVSYPPEPTKAELTSQMESRRQQEYLRKVFPLIIEQYEGKKSQDEVAQEIEKIKQENPYPTAERGK